jgi:hypothetical protein
MHGYPVEMGFGNIRTSKKFYGAGIGRDEDAYEEIIVPSRVKHPHP